MQQYSSKHQVRTNWASRKQTSLQNATSEGGIAFPGSVLQVRNYIKILGLIVFLAKKKKRSTAVARFFCLVFFS